MRSLAMKIALTLVLVVVLPMAGCSPFNTVVLTRDYTPYEAFLGDRQECVQEAQQCIWKTYAHSAYNGDPASRLLPSRGAYLRCMGSKGYYPSVSGFVPPVLVAMTDYRPGWDCFGR
jgi:hypothetical protein